MIKDRFVILQEQSIESEDGWEDNASLGSIQSILMGDETKVSVYFLLGEWTKGALTLVFQP